ncbi:GntR family transcriptional regulator [Nocardia brasiliensis]|uniref:GntR family transcriptional regulator n=1 Tax=Nocardia brasiliensis TaxID=37326 RepID=UPI003D8CC28C
MTRLTLTGQRRGLRELAYDSLREAIVTLRLEPGARITEDGLSEQLGVSRPVLREALQRLQVDQLVDRLDNGRMRVRPLSPGDATHLYAVRSALEQLAVREACARLTDTDRTALAGDMTRMRAAEHSGDAMAVAETGLRFHRRLHSIAANPVNDALMAQIGGPIDRFRHLSVAATARLPQSAAEHEAVLAALLAGAADAAASAMHRHVMSGHEAVQRALKSQGASSPT